MGVAHGIEHARGRCGASEGEQNTAEMDPPWQVCNRFHGQRAEIKHPQNMGECLRGGLGGNNGFAVKIAFIEKQIENIAGGTREQLARHDQSAAEQRCAAPFYVWLHMCGQQLNQKRHQPHAEIDHDLVGQKGNKTEGHKHQDRAQRVTPENIPADMLPP